MDKRNIQSTRKEAACGSELIDSVEVIDEVAVRFSNDGHFPKPTREMRLSTEKSNCKGDYGCCGQLP
jgi:hypothetical protein